jgi:tetratricopeptide (TPR) repeat protein
MLRVPVASLALVSALCASPFVAPAAAQSDAASRAKARDLTERAIEKVRAGDHEAAIELYLRAYELSSEAILLSNIGSAYQSLGRRERALRYFCRYLESEPNGKVAGFARDQAEQLASELGNRSSACEKPAAAGKPAGDKPDPTSGSTSAPLSAAATSGDRDTEERRRLTAALKADDSAETSEPSGEPSYASPLRIGGLAVAGGGVVALGIGGYYGFVGKRASDRISDNEDGWTSEVLEQQEIGKRANRNMKIFMISGGVAVAAGVTVYLLGRSLREDENRISLVPSVSPESSGFAVLGSF